MRLHVCVRVSHVMSLIPLGNVRILTDPLTLLCMCVCRGVRALFTSVNFISHMIIAVTCLEACIYIFITHYAHTFQILKGDCRYILYVRTQQFQYIFRNIACHFFSPVNWWESVKISLRYSSFCECIRMLIITDKNEDTPL